MIAPDGSRQDITNTAVWQSSAPAVATVGSTGLVTSLAQGTATISANSGGFTGSATVTVATLSSIAVTSASSTLPVGVRRQYTATGTFANGNSQDLTTLATWTSSAPAVATVSNDAGSKGMVTAVAAGTSVITATVGTVSGNDGVTVGTATLSSISIDQGNTSIALNTFKKFGARGRYSDNSIHDVTTSATWSASPAGIVTIGAADEGRIPVTGIAVGSATLTAAFGGQTATATISVTGAQLQSVAVNPATPAAGLFIEPVQFAAIGSFSDGTTQDLTDQVRWTSSDPAVATIGTEHEPGLAHGVSTGTTSITATPFASNVTSPAARLTITPSLPTVTELGATAGPIGQMVAIKGTNFREGGTTVTVGGIPATRIVRASSSYLEFAVPDTATGAGNPVVVTTPYGSAQAPQSFTVTTPAAAPTTRGTNPVSPLKGPAGQRVIVYGTNFVRGATSVTLGGMDVGAVTVTGTETLYFTVPAGLPDGMHTLAITTPNPPAAVLTNAFEVGIPSAPPRIDRLEPNYGRVGDYILITGDNFVFGQTFITIGEVETTPFEFGGPTSLSVLVPEGASLIGRKVTVRTPYGTAQSSENFTVTTH